MAVVVFCNDPLAPRSVDPEFSAEYQAAQETGFGTVLVSFEELSRGRGLSRPVGPVLQPGIGIYRGWMLTPPHYGHLHEALAGQGLRLVNNPAEYAHTHHFPNCYPIISGNTPASIHVRIDGSPDFDLIHQMLSTFGSQPVVLKDYVRSEKHYWREACFIPDASDRAQVERVTRRFLELRGDHLNGGLVYRAFIPLAHLIDHPKSGMPLAVEFRLFIAHGELLTISPYWEAGSYADGTPPTTGFEHIARNVRSRFFSMDIAQRQDGGWTIMELGDGQVSGLPVALDPHHFYSRLYAALNAAE